MGLLKFFSGKSPEQIEQKADSYFQNKEFGQAKIEYEKALIKLEKQSDVVPGYKNQIEKKLLQSKEGLAAEHIQNAKNLITSNCFDDAEELFHLAMELTEDENQITEIKKNLQEISDYESESEYNEAEIEEDDSPEEPWEDEEYFNAICSSLPKTEKDAYTSYGDTFQKGYVALNQGDFETAVLKLSEAMEENTSANSFISLELATAHINLEGYEEAQSLLEGFLAANPEFIRAYQLMCDIYWEKQNFQEAEKLLENCPQNIAASIPIQILKGETYFKAQKFQEAASFYQEILHTREWDIHIAQLLAKAHEAIGSNEKARDLYGEIIGACQGCGSRIDPYIKQRFAETSFEIGDFSTNTLELYLSLSQEDPENQSSYYKKISHIYSVQGNEKEAQRFLSFVEKGSGE